MREITIPSSAIAIRSEKPLTPAMVSAVWEIGGALDEQRVPAVVDNAVWVEIPTARLRGEGAREDNVWLRECLDRLTGVKISGEYRGDPWGAVVLAEWQITQGGSLARLLIPPAGVQALRSPVTFTKIEATAAHKLSGHARRLYVLLSDKKRLGQTYWTFSVSELRSLLGVDAQKSYDRWSDLRVRVLDPSIEAINDYGSVQITMTTTRVARAITAVRFDWRWKSLDQARETTEENERHSDARRKTVPVVPDAPPMIKTAAVAKVAAEKPVEKPSIERRAEIVAAARRRMAEPVEPSPVDPDDLDRDAWIQAYGSRRLRRCVEEGIECTKTYLEERSAMMKG